MRYVWLTADRQLRVHLDGVEKDITGAGDLAWVAWDQQNHEAYSWPCWSPDGRQVAAFRLSDNPVSTTLFVTDLGITGRLYEGLDRRLPICLQWTHDGQGAVVLTQDDQALKLNHIDLESGDCSPILRGTPLFFSVLPNGQVASFVGNTETARLALVDPKGLLETTYLPGIPGNFSTPLALGSQVVYAAYLTDGVEVCVATLDGHVHRLEQFEGLAALMPSPCGRYLARAIADGSPTSTYRDLVLFDLHTGEQRPLANLDLDAFFWLPDSRGLVLVQRRWNHTHLRYHLQPLHGDRRMLCDHRPAKDLRFYLRFFEQYASSHPIISPDSSEMLLAGWLLGQPSAELPQLWKIPLDGGEPTSHGEGRFAAYYHPKTNAACATTEDT